MNKISINLLCIVILATLSASVLEPLFYFGRSFTKGLEDGMAGQENVLEDKSLLKVAFNPQMEEICSPRNELQVQDGRMIPMVMTEGMIHVDDKSLPGWFMPIEAVCEALVIAAFIYLVLELILFIIQINKGNIFVEKNLRRLRVFGFCLIGISILQSVQGILLDKVVQSLHLVGSGGYDLQGAWSTPWGNLLIGLLALLMAQVWQRGLDMREEQDLTV